MISARFLSDSDRYASYYQVCSLTQSSPILCNLGKPGNRQKIAVDDPRLEDRVADNLAKHEITESESLLIGRNFGVITDIETGLNGNLFVVSLSNGTVYAIYRP